VGRSPPNTPYYPRLASRVATCFPSQPPISNLRSLKGTWSFTLGLQGCRKSLQGTKAPKSKPEITYPRPGKGRAIPPPGKTFGNHSNRPLPQKINKNSQPRPSLPINENGRTPALGEYYT